jgi:protein arginine N-methyltransferase 7
MFKPIYLSVTAAKFMRNNVHVAPGFIFQKDCIVVPSSATVYVQVVASELAQKWNRLQPIYDVAGSSVLLDTPVKMDKCSGAAAVHDIQLSQFPSDRFHTLVPPTPIFRYCSH